MILAFDPGAGRAKGRAECGFAEVPSQISTNGAEHVHGLSGMKSSKRPSLICVDGVGYYVGAFAHSFGRPVENLDFERLTGAPEMMALFFETVSKLFDGVPSVTEEVAKKKPEALWYGLPPVEPLDLWVGLPIAAMTGDSAPDTIARVKQAFRGEFSWTRNGMPQSCTMASVTVTGQPVGALMQYLLQSDGKQDKAHSADYRKEIAVINIGMSTLDLLVAENGAYVHNRTKGTALGVQAMLIDYAAKNGYTLAELDAKIRAGKFDYANILPAWQRNVFDFLDKSWTRDGEKRFARVIATGGGVHLLRQELTRRYGERLWVSGNPVMDTAEGLYRLALKQKKVTA